MAAGIDLMMAPQNPIAYELIWLMIAGPACGAVCALLARNFRRNPKVWFVLGYFLTAIALLALVMVGEDERNLPGGEPR
jgi:dipeptide/tripeptide permease